MVAVSYLQFETKNKVLTDLFFILMPRGGGFCEGGGMLPLFLSLILQHLICNRQTAAININKYGSPLQISY